MMARTAIVPVVTSGKTIQLSARVAGHPTQSLDGALASAGLHGAGAPGEAWLDRKGGSNDDLKVENGVPRVKDPTGQRLAGRPEASLASRRGNSAGEA